MRAAIIAPYNQVERYSALSSVQMILAPFLGDDSNYRNFAEKSKERGDLILLDNGACELGESMDLGKFFETICEIKPSVAVLPDSLFNAKRTIELTHSFIAKYGNSIPAGVDLMAVPQGSSAEEWEECFSTLAGTCKEVNWWGIPKVSLLLYESRRTPCEIVIAERPDDYIHLLGVHADPVKEVTEVKGLKQVVSIDTSLPVTLGRLARGLSECRPKPKGVELDVTDDPYPDWTKRQVQEFIKLVEEN